MKFDRLTAIFLTLCLLTFSLSLSSCKNGKDTTSTDETGDTEVTTSAPRPVRPLEHLPDMNPEIESNAGNNLAGYTKAQLTEKWGYPFGELYGDNGFAWLMENGLDYALARFDSQDYVTELTFYHVMKATVQEISGDTVTLVPVENMEEAKVLDAFTLPISCFSTKAQQKLGDGVLIFISYDGVISEAGDLGEVYSADVNSPLSQFARY